MNKRFTTLALASTRCRTRRWLSSFVPLRTLVTTAWVFLCATGALAQGTVRLFGSVNYQVPGSPGWPPAGSLLFGLLTAPPGTSDLSQFAPTGVLATNQATAGRVGGVTVPVPGWQPGETRAFAIIGWQASYGTNFNLAWLQQGCIVHGVSAIGTGAAGGLDPVGGPLPPLNPFNFVGPGFTISGPLSPDYCPQIQTPPVSQSAPYGSMVTFTVTASSWPQPLTYQWQLNGTNLAGATASVLVLTNAQPWQAGAYSVTVFNGLSPVSSSLALLDLYGAPIIYTNPASQCVSVGDTVNFKLTAMGSEPLSYSWYFNQTNLLGGRTNSALQLRDVQLEQSGLYSAVVTNGYGSVTSAPALLAVSQLPAIVSAPIDRSVPLGGAACFSVLAAGSPPLGYQWFFNGISLGDRGRQADLELLGVQPSNAGLYHVLVTNAFGAVTSAPVRLTVTPRLPSGTVVAWGWNGQSQTNVPSGLNHVIAIAGGSLHSLALKADGTVVAWGQNVFGECNVPPGLSNVIAIAAGGHSLALKADLTVVAWGVGRATNVPSDLRNVVGIAAGDLHSLALKADGTVVAWGDNVDGQCNVPADLTDVIAIAAGRGHNLALTSRGQVVAWGTNDQGQCGVPGLARPFAVAAGGDHSLVIEDAVDVNGWVMAWGSRDYGEGTAWGITNAVAIAAGYYHNLVLIANRSVLAWGLNSAGEAAVPAGLSNVISISAGGYHNLVIVGDELVARVSPSGQTAETGSTVKFHSEAVALPPATCRWFFNGTNALSAPGVSDLVLSDLRLDQAGAYTVVISNIFGALTSAPGVLNVIPPVERRMVPGLNLTGQTGTSMNLDFAAELGPASQWTTLATLPLGQASQWYFDLSTPLPAQRFFRAWQSGQFVPPTLDLHFVPAITMTGAIGSSLRVDYINQFGPVDAWANLATLTLTNQSQLYFDTSAIGQPPRLWRVVPVPEAQGAGPGSVLPLQVR